MTAAGEGFHTGRFLLIFAGLLLAGLLLYLPLAPAPPLLDDQAEFEAIRDAAPAAAVGHRTGPDGFHPVANAIRYGVARLTGTPAALRALSSLLHALNAFLIFVLLNRLLAGGAGSGATLVAPTAAALLFAVHPVASEAVLSQAAFPLVLGISLLLGAAVAAACHRWESYLLLLAALLCNPLLWPAGLLLPALGRLAPSGEEERPRRALSLVPYIVVILLAYLLWSLRAWPEFRLTPAHQPWSILRGIASQSAALLTEIRLLVFPAGLTLDHWSPAHGGVWNLQAVAGLLLLLALLAGFLFAGRRGGLMKLALGWFVLQHLHLLILAPDVPVSERRLYMSLVPAVLLAGAAARALERRLGARAAFVGSALVAVPLVLVAADRARQWQDPAVLWESASRLNPVSPRGPLALANRHLAGERLDDALQSFQVAQSRSPRSASIQTSIAEIHFRKGDYMMALQEVNKAMDMDPSYVPAYLTAGNSFMARGRAEDAFMFYNEALRRDPDNSSALLNLGNLFFQQRRFQAAVETLERAIDLRPGDPAILFRLGMSRLNVGDMMGAAVALEECLERAPDRIDAGVNLATVLTRLEAHEEARGRLEHVLDLDPRNAQALNGLAVIASAAEDWDEARRLFEEALAAEPGNLRFMFNLAGAHEHLGDLEQAAAAYREILEISTGDLDFSEEARIRLARVEELMKT